MVLKISLALALMTITGVASADQCFNLLGLITICPPSNPPPVQAPEIDPASAMAGLTMLRVAWPCCAVVAESIPRNKAETLDYPGGLDAWVPFRATAALPIPGCRTISRTRSEWRGSR